jgi:hypothetical protein
LQIFLSPHDQSGNETDQVFVDSGKCYFNLTTNRSAIWHTVYLDEFSIFTISESYNHQLEYHLSVHVRGLQGYLSVHMDFYSDKGMIILPSKSFGKQFLEKKTLILQYKFFFFLDPLELQFAANHHLWKRWINVDVLPKGTRCIDIHFNSSKSNGMCSIDNIDLRIKQKQI